MGIEYKGNLLKDKIHGEYLKELIPEGDYLVSEGPKGEPLWKKKKKLNEDEEKPQRLNE